MNTSELRETVERLHQLILPKSRDYNRSCMNGVRLRRVLSMFVDPELSQQERESHATESMAKALSGLASSNGRLVVRLVGSGKGQINVEMGWIGERCGTEVLEATLDGFTDGLLWADPAEEVLPPIKVGGYVLGTPSVRAERAGAGSLPLKSSELLQSVAIGMAGEAFVMTLVCEPLSTAHIGRAEVDVWAELDAISPKVSLSTTEERSITSVNSSTYNDSSTGGLPVLGAVQKGTSESSGRNTAEGESSTVQFENCGYRILVDHLTEYANRLHSAVMEGGWRVGAFLGASESSGLERLGALTVAALGGDGEAATAPSWSPAAWALRLLDGSMPEKDVVEEDHLGIAGDRQLSFCTTSELARMLALPCRDLPGYEVLPAAKFGVQPHDGGILLGQVMNRMRPIHGITVAVSSDDLTRHALVAGMTGSGKTNTVFHILNRAEVPFLVIEPVKNEYRSLLQSLPELRVYTPGQEVISPIRLNPFWFEYGTVLTLQQHVDSLKSIFCSMFAMYASMPNILERCLYSVYERKGWCLYDSSNIHACPGIDGLQLSGRFYPTLEDLHTEVVRYMSQSGYASEQEQNIRSALLVRLESLMKGGKGLLLNTYETTSAHELFEGTTVIELDAIPDEDEKALIMGLIMLRLYEHIKVNSSTGNESLRHLLIIEEAHRVFRNVPASDNPEIPNLAGRTVGMLSNMLAEIRSYGEGVIIVEQVPTKLAPDAIKNTNLKIIHRLVSGDDCDCVSSALGISAEEARACALLKRGEALVFSEGMNKPSRIRVNLASAKTSRVSSDLVRDAAIRFNSVILRRDDYSPLAATVLQDTTVRVRMAAVARKLARTLMFDDVGSYHAAWQSSIHEIQSTADRAGYGLGRASAEQVESFSDHVLRHSLNALPGKMMLIGNDVQAATFLAVFLERALSYSRKPYDNDSKALDQMGAVRTAVLYPDLTRIYQRGLNSEICDGRLDAIPFSHTDGEAIEILRDWLKVSSISMMQEAHPSLEGFVSEIRRRVSGEFAVPPRCSQVADAITRRIVSFVIGERMTEPGAHRILFHRNNSNS